MKNLKFPFTGEGVQDWKNQLYASSDEIILQEQQLIALAPSRWLPLRFALEPSQIDYMHSLGTVSLDQIAKDINEAINNRADITLRRDQPNATPQNSGSLQQTPPQNSKVADSKKTYRPQSSPRESTSADEIDSLLSLDFHFYYTDNAAQP